MCDSNSQVMFNRDKHCLYFDSADSERPNVPQRVERAVKQSLNQGASSILMSNSDYPRHLVGFSSPDNKLSAVLHISNGIQQLWILNLPSNDYQDLTSDDYRVLPVSQTCQAAVFGSLFWSPDSKKILALIQCSNSNPIQDELMPYWYYWDLENENNSGALKNPQRSLLPYQALNVVTWEPDGKNLATFGMYKNEKKLIIDLWSLEKKELSFKENNFKYTGLFAGVERFSFDLKDQTVCMTQSDKNLFYSQKICWRWFKGCLEVGIFKKKYNVKVDKVLCEIFLIVVNYLDLKEILSLRGCCKYLNRLTKNANVWNRLNKQDYPYDPKLEKGILTPEDCYRLNASIEKNIFLLKIKNHLTIRAFKGGNSKQFYFWSPDSNFIACHGSNFQQVKIINASTGQAVLELDYQSVIKWSEYKKNITSMTCDDNHGLKINVYPLIKTTDNADPEDWFISWKKLFTNSPIGKVKHWPNPVYKFKLSVWEPVNVFESEGPGRLVSYHLEDQKGHDKYKTMRIGTQYTGNHIKIFSVDSSVNYFDSPWSPDGSKFVFFRDELMYIIDFAGHLDGLGAKEKFPLKLGSQESARFGVFDHWVPIKDRFKFRRDWERLFKQQESWYPDASGISVDEKFLLGFPSWLEGCNARAMQSIPDPLSVNLD